MGYELHQHPLKVATEHKGPVQALSPYGSQLVAPLTTSDGRVACTQGMP